MSYNLAPNRAKLTHVVVIVCALVEASMQVIPAAVVKTARLIFSQALTCSFLYAAGE